MPYDGSHGGKDYSVPQSAGALLRARDEIVERLINFARVCPSVRSWAARAGVSETLIRKMRQGEIPKLETLAALEMAMPVVDGESPIAIDLAYFEEPLSADEVSALGEEAGLLHRALQVWRLGAPTDGESEFRQRLDREGISRRMTTVRFDQSGLLRFDYWGQDMGQLRNTYLNRPVRHLVNARLAEAAEIRMLKADMQGQPQVSRISFGLPGQGIVRCLVLNLPFIGANGQREVVNVSARF